MAHLQSKKALGKIMHIMMEWYQQTAGIRTNFLKEALQSHISIARGYNN